MKDTYIVRREFELDGKDIPKLHSKNIGDEVKVFRLSQVQWNDKAQKFLATYHEVRLPEAEE